MKPQTLECRIDEYNPELRGDGLRSGSRSTAGYNWVFPDSRFFLAPKEHLKTQFSHQVGVIPPLHPSS
jgi:hypothetical protein